MTSDLDLRERRELADLFDELGPDAPTLCGEWTTSDLAAHLVVRERDPIGASGILIPRFEDLTARHMAGELAKHGYAGTVERVRTGPPFGPMAIAPVRHAVNLLEYFVHHEDVRRPNGRTARTDRPDLDAELWGFLGRMGPLMVRRAKLPSICLTLVTPSGEERTLGKGDAEVTLFGTPGELVMELYGRQAHADVTYEGPAASVAAVRGASFGI